MILIYSDKCVSALWMRHRSLNRWDCSGCDQERVDAFGMLRRAVRG